MLPLEPPLPDAPSCIPTTQPRLAKLFGWDFSRLSALLMRDGHSVEEADTLIAEYRKFMGLHLLYPDKSFPMVKAVDPAWHAHILDTYEYEKFCKTVFGKFIHHRPFIMGEVGSSVDTAVFLKKTYRSVSTLWTETGPGNGSCKPCGIHCDGAACGG